MEILINGETQQVPPQTSLQELLRLLQLQEARVAVELNKEIVRRERWAETQLHEQDQLEIVQFVGGG
ncbi:MAG: thiamine biosynthesis protein ThiS [Acidobacteria bacterium RIFCSPLOWO2_12_FULL_59_11]|nr:MAG: thiamine biosynthesis protein ThiS [Acidobacteria bacterium RIFCSPLOWO2_12_FULL_59_11]